MTPTIYTLTRERLKAALADCYHEAEKCRSLAATLEHRHERSVTAKAYRDTADGIEWAADRFRGALGMEVSDECDS